MNNIKQVHYDSNLYWKILRLREIVLRLPLGLRFDIQSIEKEEPELIYAYMLDDRPIATAQFILSENSAKMRQVATHPKHQSQGIGKELYVYAEEQLKNKGISSINCHAREHAIPFYKKMGFKENSDSFIEVGIPHKSMIKSI